MAVKGDGSGAEVVLFAARTVCCSSCLLLVLFAARTVCYEVKDLSLAHRVCG